ncbi:MAG: class I SAM-dependent methyltransferase [Candidatus Bathyarchaeota archaeon]|jgi:demethylmenaquinone methyltransferase/2-methoxy-6-polyprenyl-1,4-benzoquinol methylase
MTPKDYFDKAAETWDEKFHTPKLSKFLEKLVPQFGIQAGQKVLDVGTGTGVLVPYLTKAVEPDGSVTAIDFSEKMVQKCEAKHGHLRNFAVEVGNIEEATFPPENFDVVVCFGVFPHLGNKEEALRNINCILKTGGKLVIAHAFSSEELKIHHKKASKHVAHDTMPEKKEMIRLLEHRGFTKISIKDEAGCYLGIAYKA